MWSKAQRYRPTVSPATSLHIRIQNYLTEKGVAHEIDEAFYGDLIVQGVCYVATPEFFWEVLVHEFRQMARDYYAAFGYHEDKMQNGECSFQLFYAPSIIQESTDYITWFPREC
jgi:hypothetical protein